MLSGDQGLGLFLEGIWNSVLLVLGSILFTVLSALAFYRLSLSGWLPVRLTTRIVCLAFLNAPLLLILVLTYLLVSGVFLYTGPVAVLTAIFVIGLDNGASAGEALLQARRTLPAGTSLADIVRVSAIQFRASVINASKASPVAAFIGAPELLSVLTDITSFSGERVVTFTVLALFYLLVVQVVIVTSAALVRRLQSSVPGESHA